MRIVAGFLRPPQPRARVRHDIETESVAAKRRIGYLPEGAPSYPEMTPRLVLEFISGSARMPAARRRQRLDEVFALLHLERVLEQSIDTLSKAIGAAWVSRKRSCTIPEVLILDERPTASIRTRSTSSGS